MAEKIRTLSLSYILLVLYKKKCMLFVELLVSFVAVIRVVTQRGEALRDDPDNGCEGDYGIADLK